MNKLISRIELMAAILLFSIEPSVSAPLITPEMLTKLTAEPRWADLSPDDQKQRNQILERLIKLKIYDNAQLRTSIENIQKKHGDNIGIMSNIFVLNRVLFKVPTSHPRDKYISHGGWSYPKNTISKDVINLLWPLTYDGEGILHLKGVFDGYFGETYDAVGEFDMFLKNFGRSQ